MNSFLRKKFLFMLCIEWMTFWLWKLATELCIWLTVFIRFSHGFGSLLLIAVRLFCNFFKIKAALIPNALYLGKWVKLPRELIFVQRKKFLFMLCIELMTFWLKVFDRIVHMAYRFYPFFPWIWITSFDWS